MPDNLTLAQRRKNMQAIRSKNTQPERLLRTALHISGFRFRLYNSKLPGKPDIVLSKYHSVVFVNGCFWHRHKGCKRCTTPKTNQNYWLNKFQHTVIRDKVNQKELITQGWHVFVIWECSVNTEKRAECAIDWLINKLGNLPLYPQTILEFPEQPS